MTKMCYFRDDLHSGKGDQIFLVTERDEVIRVLCEAKDHQLKRKKIRHNSLFVLKSADRDQI